jgi:hypothetical protein
MKELDDWLQGKILSSGIHACWKYDCNIQNKHNQQLIAGSFSFYVGVCVGGGGVMYETKHRAARSHQLKYTSNRRAASSTPCIKSRLRYKMICGKEKSQDQVFFCLQMIGAVLFAQHGRSCCYKDSTIK